MRRSRGGDGDLRRRLTRRRDEQRLAQRSEAEEHVAQNHRRNRGEVL